MEVNRGEFDQSKSSSGNENERERQSLINLGMGNKAQGESEDGSKINVWERCMGLWGKTEGLCADKQIVRLEMRRQVRTGMEHNGQQRLC